MVRPAGQEAIAIEKIVCYRSQEGGTCYAAQGRMRSGGRRSKEKTQAFIVVSVERVHSRTEAGYTAGLTGLNHLSRLWGLRAVLSCLETGPVVIRAGS